MKTLCFIGVLLWAGLAQAETLAWNANSEPDLAGYFVYERTGPIYGPPIAKLGKVTTYDTGALPVGQTFFALTAYDTSGNESVKSAEVSKIILPAPLPPTIEDRLAKIEATLTALCRALGGC